MHGSEVEARSGDIPVDYNKSTLKHLFGTGKDNQVSLKREVLFKSVLSHMKNTVKVEDAEDF
jgi:hypothetical protein